MDFLPQLAGIGFVSLGVQLVTVILVEMASVAHRRSKGVCAVS